MFKKIIILLSLLSVSLIASASDYSYFKEKPLTIIIPFSPGGTTDIIGRALANSITSKYGIKTVVINKPGAAGSVASSYISQQPADGHTIMFGNSSPILNHLIGIPGSPNLNQLDFIIPIMESSQSIVVSADKSPDIKTYKDLVSKMNSNANYASAFNMLQVWVGVVAEHENIEKPQQIVYKSQAEVITALLRGDVLFTFSGLPDSIKLIEAGKIKPLATGANKRNPRLPNVPTFKELGVKNAIFSSYFGVWVPTGMNKKVKEDLNMLFQDALWDGNTVVVFHNNGLIPIGGDLNASNKFYRFLLEDHTMLVSKHKELLKQ
jgi:tripartite-type tricarboxylate transporter receptor subunit TctC